jgi:hypothetical protein
MESTRPRELYTAARVVDALVYVAGMAGIVAGGLLFRDDQVAFAVVAWALTFVAAAGLRLASAATRALAELLQRTERMDDELARLRANTAAPARPVGSSPQPSTEAVTGPEDGPIDPYKRWGGWH